MALIAPVVMSCDGELFGEEKVEPTWCTTTWMCNSYSGAATFALTSECPEGQVPAICLYNGDTDASDEDIYCHDAELFEESCLYESKCSWDEEAGYYLVECTEVRYGMP